MHAYPASGGRLAPPRGSLPGTASAATAGPCSKGPSWTVQLAVRGLRKRISVLQRQRAGLPRRRRCVSVQAQYWGQESLEAACKERSPQATLSYRAMKVSLMGRYQGVRIPSRDV